VIVAVRSVSFIVPPYTASLSFRKPGSAGRARDSCATHAKNVSLGEMFRHKKHVTLLSLFLKSNY
jgi:hypothetical protein